MTHLLPLSTLHTAAPGILDVVFGPDGDFEGAPKWSGPVVGPAVHQHIVFDSVVEHSDDGLLLFHGADIQPWTDGDPLDWFALDLRIHSVASRLAGLCARALGIVDCRGAYMGQAGCLFAGSRLIARWDQWGRRHIHEIGEAPDLDPETPWEPETLLAALTLALAPRIAGLGGANAAS